MVNERIRRSFLQTNNRNKNDAYNQGYTYYNLIMKEIKLSENKYFKNGEKNLLSEYYRKSHTLLEFTRHYYAERMKFLIQNVKKGTKILDIGCGLGSETILCGLLGGHVTGLDIREPVISVAKKRIKYYEEDFNCVLNVNFSNENILSHSGKYDLIWINEAISHIEPVSDLIKVCHKLLNKGGRLIISDTNKLNPIMFYLHFLRPKFSKELRKRYKKHITKDPRTGDPVTIVEERLLNTFALKRITCNGFIKSNINHIGFFPFALFRRFPKLCVILERRILQKMPLIKNLAGLYIFVCLKKI